MQYVPHEYQAYATNYIVDHPISALLLDMGLGKTFIASEKMKELGDDLALIICPKSVIDTWIDHIKTYYL